MKVFKLLLATLALGFAITPAIHAQPEHDGPPPGERGGKGPGGGRLKMLSEELALTDAQKEQVKAILAEERTALEALRADTSVTDEARREKRQAIMKDINAKIRAVLTPEQQKKFDELRPRGPGGPGGKKKD